VDPDPGIAGRLLELRARIARAVGRSGREATAVRLVGAAKTVPAARLVEAFRAGLTDLGENRVQEAEEKIPTVAALLAAEVPEVPGSPGPAGTPGPLPAPGPPPSVRPVWHLIGHLQSNKARRAAALFDWIESVDSLRLAQALDRHAAELDRRLDVLIEVNTSGEAAKAGVASGEAVALVQAVAALPHLTVRGLMTVGPLVESPDAARPAYRILARLLAEAQAAVPQAPLLELSMGMSGDFEVAIEEGATIVRVGTALFGARAAARVG
jgi:hypothetical protein